MIARLVLSHGHVVYDCMYYFLKNLFFFPTAPSSSSQRLTVIGQIEKFYKDVQTKRKENAPSTNDNTLDLSAIPGLTAELRGYQRQGVQWMLEKEGKLGKGEEEGTAVAVGPCQLHMLWKELPTLEHGLPCAVYFNVHSGK